MSTVPLSVLRVRLDEARAAYHQLQTGTMARVVVDVDGTRVEFVAGNATRLYAYIQELERKVCPAMPVSNGPLGFIF